MGTYSCHIAQHHLGSFNQCNKTMLRNKGIGIKKEDKVVIFKEYDCSHDTEIIYLYLLQLIKISNVAAYRSNV